LGALFEIFGEKEMKTKLENCFRTKTGELVVHKKDIERFAYRQLREWKKDYFSEPKALNVDSFVENQLKFDVNYQQLSPNGTIFGVTIIKDGVIQIINEEGCPEKRLAKRGEIFVDQEACHKKNGVINYTILHESWHRQFDMDTAPAFLCRGFCVEDSQKDINGYQERNWMEWHAEVYPSFLLMPTPFVRTIWAQKHDEYLLGKRFSTGKVRLGWRIVSEMAEFFGASKSAMMIRLKELKLLSQDMYDAMKNYGGF
jgi:hypothetical protein